MKRFLPRVKSIKGFTLIELLVVIGILGILAAALVATIDPFEQLNKAQDANTKNTLVEFIDANVRYYTTHSAMPWEDTANASGANCWVAASAAAISAGGANLSNLNSGVGCVYALVADGELKSSFTTVTNILNQIYITGTSTNVTACFAPKSKAQRNASDSTNNNMGGVQANCPNATAGTCFWCSE